VAYGDCAGDNDRVTDAAFHYYRRLVFRITGLITLGIWCYLILLVFQLITLPVEFDASRRAKIILREMGIIQPGEEAVVNKVLNAAALTYIAAFVAALGNLLWLMSIRDRR
jgi:Predicted Zn-dependent protease